MGNRSPCFPKINILTYSCCFHWSRCMDCKYKCLITLHNLNRSISHEKCQDLCMWGNFSAGRNGLASISCQEWLNPALQILPLQPWDVLISVPIHLEGSAETVKEMLIVISHGDPWGIMLGLRNHKIGEVTPQSGIKVMSSAPSLLFPFSGSLGDSSHKQSWCSQGDSFVATWPPLSPFCLILVLILLKPSALLKSRTWKFSWLIPWDNTCCLELGRIQPRTSALLAGGLWEEFRGATIVLISENLNKFS